MAIRNIRKDDDPILRKQSREVTVFDSKLHQLLDDMADTMNSVSGVGIAGVQVGILRRVIVIDVGDGLIELVNPVITYQTKHQVTDAEGCLSFPKQWGAVPRPFKVTVKAQTRHGDMTTITGEELLARAICHEVDHLDGIIFKDKATRMIDPKEMEDK